MAGRVVAQVRAQSINSLCVPVRTCQPLLASRSQCCPFLFAPASFVRHPAVDLSVEAAGPQQRRIDEVRPRGGSDDAHALQPLNAIKLRKQLVHHSVGHTCIDTTAAAGQRGGTAGSHTHKLSASTMSGYEKPLSQLVAFTCHSPTHLPLLSSSLTASHPRPRNPQLCPPRLPCLSLPPSPPLL